MKRLIVKIIRLIKFGYKADSDSYKKYLCKKGITLGDNVNFYSPQTIRIDITNPYLIKIGNNVHITAGVTILNHGYDWIVASKRGGQVFGNIGKVQIGNNVFIGNNVTILKGSIIGDDVIIGANALVNKPCITPGVYGGIPAKYIMSIEEYAKKRSAVQYEEARDIVRAYYEKYGKKPTENLRALRAYFWLWTPRDARLNTIQKQINARFSKTNDVFVNSTPKYSSFDCFLSDALSDKASGNSNE